jgi:hypothetical protein
MLLHAGVDAIIDDDATDRLITLCQLTAGASLWLLTAVAIGTTSTDVALALTPLVFAIGFTSVGLPLALVEGVVSSLFVAFALEPNHLSAVHPIIFARFSRLSELRLLQTQPRIGETPMATEMRRHTRAGSESL